MVWYIFESVVGFVIRCSIRTEDHPVSLAGRRVSPQSPGSRARHSTLTYPAKDDRRDGCSRSLSGAHVMTTTSGPRTFLIPLDGSRFAERAIPYAALAFPDDEIVLLQVTGHAEPVRSLLGRFASHEEQAKTKQQDAEHYLADAGARWATVLRK